MNFKTIALLIIFLVSIGMSSAATIHLQYLGDKYHSMSIKGVLPNGSTTNLETIQNPESNFKRPYPNSYDYSHTGEYESLQLGVSYGVREHTIYLYIKNLDNLYSYPSPIQLTFENAVPGSRSSYDYGILGLDGSLHNPDYCIPSYTG